MASEKYFPVSGKRRRARGIQRRARARKQERRRELTPPCAYIGAPDVIADYIAELAADAHARKQKAPGN